MMDIIIKPKSLGGTIEVISSKSLSHRYVIAAALSNESSTISNVLKSQDLIATKDALSVLGATFEGDKVQPADLVLRHKEVNMHESGSTLRFMIPILMLQQQEVIVKGMNRLVDRPLDVYDQLFKDKKVVFEHLDENHQLPVLLKGKIKGGHYPLRGDISSQFISGLLFALPLTGKDSVIELTSPLESKGYVDLTLDVLKKFGIHILNVDQYIYIRGGQKYQAHDAVVEGDFSQSAFWFAAGVIGRQPLRLKHLNPQSLQGDKAIVDILKSMGAHITYKDDCYEVLPSQTKGVKIDLSQVPDLGPMLMGVAALSEGVTTFVNFERLRIKESDRVEAMKDVLSRYGVDMHITDQVISIEGKKQLKGHIEIDTFNDHRIAMAASVLAIRADGDVVIKDSTCINKSYPIFYDDYKKLGGEIIEVK